MSTDNREHPFPGNLLVHVQGMAQGGSDDDSPAQAQREIRTVTDDLAHAMVLTSDTGRDDYPTTRRDLVTGEWTTEPGERLHRPVIDLDMPARLIESSTPGHFHLLIDRPIAWTTYTALLDALAAAGLVEAGYVAAAKRRGHTGVRVPWFRKGDQAPPPPPGAEFLPAVGDLLDDYAREGATR